ncbi:E2 domain-associated cysteine-rich protein [Nitrobacter sp. JJSN]|uniref:E2 domain-associated cysteine-rich protein n=1 Tax=Nitrobacter sp. JJSN TaxID=3453033 RepID=UPI003F760BDA
MGITDETAPAWWKKLHAFALWQETAVETGFWPSEGQLSHGEAAEWELAAENAADQLGLRSVYREAVAFDTGIIAAGVSRVSTKNGVLRNGRSACICGRTDRRGRRLLRRDCRDIGQGCPILFEHRRRVSIDEFWRGLRGCVACCGTMKECPLRAGDGTTVDGRTLPAAETHTAQFGGKA